MGANYSLFLRRFFLLSAAALLAILAFNILIDAYMVFGTPTWRGINAEKHGVDRHARIAKAYALRSYRPQAVILGSSRAESAFDPMHPYFHGLKTYNLAFPGASLYEQYRYLQHASAGGALREALVSVDFFQFLGGAQWVSDDFDESRLAVDDSGLSTAYPWRDTTRLALSGSAVHDSLRSLRNQRRKPSIYRADGYRDDSGDVPEMLKKPGGQHAEFLLSEKGYAQTYRLNRTLVKNSRTLPRTAFEDLQRLLEWSRNHNIAVTLVIPPLHARHLELIWQLGMWPQFEDWKRRLALKVGGMEAKGGCRLWDFAEFNVLTNEELPTAGMVMRWWRESSHASSAAGRAMLDQMMRADQVQTVGHCLHSAELDVTLRLTREKAKTWRSAHPQDVAEIMQILEQYGRLDSRPGASGERK